MSPEVVARILKGTLRPGPRDVHTATYTYYWSGPSGQVESGRCIAFHLDCVCVASASPLTAGRRPATALLLRSGPPGQPGPVTSPSPTTTITAPATTTTHAPASAHRIALRPHMLLNAAWAFAVNNRFSLPLRPAIKQCINRALPSPVRSAAPVVSSGRVG
jgi:hypothetical protein